MRTLFSGGGSVFQYISNSSSGVFALVSFHSLKPSLLERMWFVRVARVELELTYFESAIFLGPGFSFVTALRGFTGAEVWEIFELEADPEVS